jgi:hypothetical protein
MQLQLPQHFPSPPAPCRSLLPQDDSSNSSAVAGFPNLTFFNQGYPSYPQGSCDYGPGDYKTYPFFGVALISPRLPLALSLPMAACGACLQIRCTDDEKVSR